MDAIVVAEDHVQVQVDDYAGDDGHDNDDDYGSQTPISGRELINNWIERCAVADFIEANPDTRV